MIGPWPIDLTLELDDDEIRRFRESANPPSSPTAASDGPAESVPSRPAHEPHWDAAQDVLRKAGQLDGPLLSQALEALTGNAGTAKALMVRLRHSPRVRLESRADVHVYHWVEPGE